MRWRVVCARRKGCEHCSQPATYDDRLLYKSLYVTVLFLGLDSVRCSIYLMKHSISDIGRSLQTLRMTSSIRPLNSSIQIAITTTRYSFFFGPFVPPLHLHEFEEIAHNTHSSHSSTGSGSLYDQWPSTVALSVEHYDVVGTTERCGKRMGHWVPGATTLFSDKACRVREGYD